MAAAGIVMMAALARGHDDGRAVVAVDDLHVLPGHGFLTRMSRAAGPLTTAAVVITPSCTCTWTFERCWRKTVPSAFQPGGTAGRDAQDPVEVGRQRLVDRQRGHAGVLVVGVGRRPLGPRFASPFGMIW